MPHKIQHYNPNCSFPNAPSVQVSVLVEKEGEPAKSVSLVATDADARAICKMEKNPDWNGFGTPASEGGFDDLIATGEVDFAALKAFVEKKMAEADSPTLPATLAERAEMAAAVERRAHQALVAAREAETKMQELSAKEAEVSRSLETKQKELADAVALVEVKKTEAVLLEDGLNALASDIEARRKELMQIEGLTREAEAPIDLATHEYEPGDRVYNAADTRKRFIGVVSFVERTPTGKLYHVNWTGGASTKGTHRAKELVPEDYTPPAEGG